MRRHLTEEEAVNALRRGATVEQLLDAEPHAGRATVRWLSIVRRGDAFVVLIHHVYDEGTSDFLDVGEFEPVDVEEYLGEGLEVTREPEPERALLAACRHGAVPEHWVNEGVVAAEYADARGWS